MTLRNPVLIATITACLAVPSVHARQTGAQSSSAFTVSPSEIQIDDDCRVLTAGRASVSNPSPKPHYRYNSIICHIESVHVSDYWEQKPSQGSKHIYVIVSEREYVLQNTSSDVVTFVVSRNLPKGWSIDSDPAPFEITDKAAVFRVIAQPGEVVRLHIGSRSNA
jgi:hypothetical protein